MHACLEKKKKLPDVGGTYLHAYIFFLFLIYFILIFKCIIFYLFLLSNVVVMHS